MVESKARRRRYNRSLSLLLRIYVYLGILTAMLGAGWFVFTVARVQLDSESAGALALAVGGGFIALAAQLISREIAARQNAPEETNVAYSYSEQSPRDSAAALVLIEWSLLEAALRQRTAPLIPGKEAPAKTVRSMVAALNQNGLLSEAELNELSLLLPVRNAIAHGLDDDSSEKTLLNVADRIRGLRQGIGSSEDRPAASASE